MRSADIWIASSDEARFAQLHNAASAARATSGRSTVSRIYANLGFLLGGKAGAGIISLAYMAIAARALGPTSYGILILLHTYTIFIGGIVNFPGWHAVVRYGAIAQSDGDVPRMFRLLRRVATVELSAGIAAVACAAILAPVIGPHLGWDRTALQYAGVYSLAVLASVRSTPAGLLQLLRRFDLLGVHNLVAPGVRLAGAGLALLLGAGLRGFIIAWLVAALAECAVLWIMGAIVARRQFGRPSRPNAAGTVKDENPGIWRFMLAANADVTFSELAGRLAPLTIGWILGPAAAGLYAVAQRVTVIFAQPAQILGQAAYAELARLAADHSNGGAIRHALIRCVLIALAAALPVFALLILFARGILDIIAGPGFEAAAGVTLLLALARVIQLAAPPVSAALVALGRPGISVTTNVATSLILWPLLPLLLAHWALAGSGFHALVQAMVSVTALCLSVWRVTKPLKSAA
jgi:O-antigen/teichoic acid export membrane protein